MKKNNLKYILDLGYFSAKKGMGSSKNGRDSAGKRLGVKKTDGEWSESGSILYRQRGTKVHPGKNVGIGKDYTLYAKSAGIVKWSKGGYQNKTMVNIIKQDKKI